MEHVTNQKTHQATALIHGKDKSKGVENTTMRSGQPTGQSIGNQSHRNSEKKNKRAPMKAKSKGPRRGAKNANSLTPARPGSKRRNSPGGGASAQLGFVRHFTQEGRSPLDEHGRDRFGNELKYIKTSSAIKDTDGSIVFEMKDIEVPASWSQLAVDIVVSKYFRKAGVPKTGHEVSVRQVVTRIARTVSKFGQKAGYFNRETSQIFQDELSYMLIHQMGAFNSPVWFNLGLWHEYGIEGSGGNFRWSFEKEKPLETDDSYQFPQCSACFIQSVDDDLMSIFDLVKKEARLFKFGSGTGTNFSRIRGRQEKLSGGGTSSGLMSFLEVFDKGAGATKSGGTTRRAAKMVCLDMEHPEIEDFITWKKREEKKVKALIDGGYSSDFNGDAYRTVSGQNSNNSVRVNDEFMQAVENDSEWMTRARTTGEMIEKFQARDLWHQIADSAWACADPGVQYDSTINDWHTCPNSDRINASNPCSEYMFLDDSACNLASLNLVKFLDKKGNFDLTSYRQAIRVFIAAQEMLVDLSSYPSQQIAQNSHDYRPLGLGYANLGTMLMLKGIPYDSQEGRSWAGALTAIMCGHAYATSAEEAEHLGPFAGFEKNRKPMIRVMEKHRKAAYGIEAGAPEELLKAAKEDWDHAVELGKRHGYRNAQATVLAPTGTIGLLMDCDTTGIEPDFALVKFKKLAGGGYFKIINQSVPLALKNLGYTQDEIENIIRYVMGSLNFENDSPLNEGFLKSKGWTDDDLRAVEKSLPSTFDISSAFSRFMMGDERLKRLGVPESVLEAPTFNYLDWLGVSESDREAANIAICGTMTVEGAPGLKDEHLPVFDCANRCGALGQRFIEPMGHVKMMAAAQPFLSGAISKTVNLPNDTSVEEIKDIYYQGWKMGLKAVALYRDGCKLSQPLSTKRKGDKAESSDKIDTDQAVAAPVAMTGDPAQITFAPMRRKLPNKRYGITQEAAVGGHKVYLRTGEYEDGSIGEIFIDLHKEGAAYRSIMNCFAISVSLGLQYGVPLKEFVDKFTFTRFEPSGMVTGHPNIKFGTSVVDYIFRVLGMEYLGRTDFLQVKPEPAVDLSAEKGSAERMFPKNPSELIASRDPKSGIEPQMSLNLDKKDLHNHQESKGGVSDSQAGNQAGDQSGYLAEMMGDAPPCDSCGHTTVRNGSCYRCLNCGNSMGCS